MIKDFTVDELKEIIKECDSKSEFARKLGYKSTSGNVLKTIDRCIDKHNLNDEHLINWRAQKDKIKYKRIVKQCPVCGKEFKTKAGHKREKTTCSYACSNTYFRSGKDNPNWKEYTYEGKEYRTICFAHHKKECIICGEKNVVAVHHYDCNNKNNDPENLIPLCMTHHVYIHSNQFAPLIEEQVKAYIEEFRQNLKKVGE